MTWSIPIYKIYHSSLCIHEAPQEQELMDSFTVPLHNPQICLPSWLCKNCHVLICHINPQWIAVYPKSTAAPGIPNLYLNLYNTQWGMRHCPQLTAVNWGQCLMPHWQPCDNHETVYQSKELVKSLHTLPLEVCRNAPRMPPGYHTNYLHEKWYQWLHPSW